MIRDRIVPPLGRQATQFMLLTSWSVGLGQGACGTTHPVGEITLTKRAANLIYAGNDAQSN